MKKLTVQWKPEPGLTACYTGTRSRVMRRNNRVKVIAEATGRRLIVEMLNASGKAFGSVVVMAKNVAPIQNDFFVRVIY